MEKTKVLEETLTKVDYDLNELIFKYLKLQEESNMMVYFKKCLEWSERVNLVLIGLSLRLIVDTFIFCICIKDQDGFGYNQNA